MNLMSWMFPAAQVEFKSSQISGKCASLQNQRAQNPFYTAASYDAMQLLYKTVWVCEYRSAHCSGKCRTSLSPST